MKLNDLVSANFVGFLEYAGDGKDDEGQNNPDRDRQSENH
jgi:hypothetical protein